MSEKKKGALTNAELIAKLILGMTAEEHTRAQGLAKNCRYDILTLAWKLAPKPKKAYQKREIPKRVEEQIAAIAKIDPAKAEQFRQLAIQANKG